MADPARTITDLTAYTAGDLVDANTWFGTDDSANSVSRKVSLAELKKTGVQAANSGQYGAVGDGSTNDTTALQAWLDAYDDGVRLFTLEPNKTYVVNSRILLDQMNDFVIDLNGSTIKCGSTSPVDYTGQAINIARCERFEIKNGVIDGNRDNRGTPAQVPAHNVALYGCDDFTFYRVTSKNAVVDGFYLDEYTSGDRTTNCTRGTFLNCVADNNTRQGISVIAGQSITVKGGAYINTNGLQPAAGIDLEADAPTGDPGVSDCVIDGAYFTGNHGPSIQLSNVSAATDTKVVNCTMDGASAEWTCTIDDPTDVLTATGHTLIDGDIVTFRAAGTYPTNIANTSTYFVVNVSGNTFQISDTAGGAAKTIGDDVSVLTVGVTRGYLTCGTSAQISNNTFKNIIPIRGCIDVISGSEGVVSITGNKFENIGSNYRNKSCVYSHVGSSGRLVVSGNQAETINHFCFIASAYAEIIGNDIKTASLDYGGALITSGSRSVIFSNNAVSYANVNAVYVYGSSATQGDIVIANNVITNTTNIAAAGKEDYGTIRIDAPNCIVSGNILRLDSTTYDEAAAWAIRATVSGSLISGNIASGYSVTNPFSVDAGVTGRITSSNLPMNMVTATSLDATPSVRGSEYLTTANAGATTITAFDDGVAGQPLLVKIGDANTTIDFSGTTLKGNAGVDWTPASGDAMRCVYDGTNWYCTIIDATV